MVIRMIKELSENYKVFSGNCNNMKTYIDTIKRNQSELKNTIPEMKNTLEVIKDRLDEEEDWIINLEYKVEKTPLKEAQRKEI